MNPARTPSILVVDDEQDTCQNLADILSDLDYTVDTALSGPAALELLRRKRYDVALLDLKMPGMDGLTLYREARKIQAEMVAMIVTAYANARTADEALKAGAWHVLAKPVDLSKLLTLVNNAVQQPLVLVVDDDAELCDNLWELFRQRELRVSLAHSEQQALLKLDNEDFDVVLADLRLPGGDGRNVLKTIRQRFPDARTILITAHRSEVADDDLKAGDLADAVCYKPFDIPRLLQTVDCLAHGGEIGADREVRCG